MQRYKTEYDAQAGEFMRKWGVKIRRHFVGKMRYFPYDREPRNVWEITLERGDHGYSFAFGDSFANTQKSPRHEPSDYNILACASVDSRFDCADVRDMIDKYGCGEPGDQREFDILNRILLTSNEHSRKLREMFADCLDELRRFGDMADVNPKLRPELEPLTEKIQRHELRLQQYGEQLREKGGYKDYETQFAWDVLHKVMMTFEIHRWYDEYGCNDQDITALAIAACKKAGVL